MDQKSKSIDARQAAQKEALIVELKKTPIVHVACQKSGISRATYYRWRKDDEVFSDASDQALLEGSLLVNDMAESQLMNAIKERNMTAIIFWLRHHHSQYTNRVEVTARVHNINQSLTPEQQQVVDEALKLAALTDIAGERKEQDNDQSNTDKRA